MWQSLTSSSVTGCSHTLRHPGAADAHRPAAPAAVHACLLWQHGSRCRYAPARTPLSCVSASTSGVTSIQDKRQQRQQRQQQLAVHQTTQPSSSPSSTQSQAQGAAGPHAQPHTTPIPQQVTRHNFPSALPIVQAALRGCTFFALDCEFSGLSAKDPPLDQLLDDAGDRYSRLATEIKDFVVLQFGLSTFHWRPDTNSYEACTFNFWLFPQATNGEPDMRFRCQASSLSFLVAQGFDFNRCICDGIPFGRNVAQGQPRTLKKPPPARKAASATGATGSSGADSQSACSGASSVERGNSSTVGAADSSASSTSDRSTGRGEGGSVSSSGSNGTNSRNHNSTASGGSSSSGSGSKATGAGCGEGAAQLMRLLRDCGRPAVVHNGLQDLLFVMQQFVGPLPDTWDEFKALAAVWFPGGMYDTKAIAADLRRTHPAQVRSFGFLRLEDLLLALQPGGEIETAASLKAAATAVTPSGAASRPIAGEEAEVEAAGFQAKERAAQASAGAESTGGLETLALGSWLPDVDHAPGFDLYRELVLEARAAGSITEAPAETETSGEGDGSPLTSEGEQTEADGEGDSEAAELALAEGPGAGGGGVAGSYEGLSVRAADGGAKVHEAGYDAYITGQVFARLLAVSQRLLPAGTAEPPVPGSDSPALSAWSPAPSTESPLPSAELPAAGAESPAPGAGSSSPSGESTGWDSGAGEQGPMALTSERPASDFSMQIQQGQQRLAQAQGTAQAPATPSPTAQQATRAMGHSVQPCAGPPGLALAERHWRGRLHVMSCDLPYMTLSGPDPKADRSTVLYISGLPPFTKVYQLRYQLREAGLGRTLVLFQQRIVPGQPRSALVRVPAQHAASAAEAIKALGPKWTVIGYEEYKERQLSRGQGQRAQQRPGTQPGQGRGKAKP